MTGPARRWLPIAATAALAFLGGVAVGGHRVSAPVPPAGAGTSGGADDADSTTVPTDTPHTSQPPKNIEDGAVRAAILLATAFDGVGLLDDRRREQLLDRHAAAAHRDELGRTLGDVARLITTDLGIEVADIQRPESIWRAVPAGVRVESATADRAVVDVWGTGIVVVRGLAMVQPGWRTTRVEMVWERDAWRLVAFRSEAGPEPPSVGGTTDAALQARVINQFAPLPHTTGRPGNFE